MSGTDLASSWAPSRLTWASSLLPPTTTPAAISSSWPGRSACPRLAASTRIPKMLAYHSGIKREGVTA